MIKVGMIGAGEGSHRHIEALSRIADVEIAAVCDLIEDVARKAAESIGCRYYLSHYQLFEREPRCRSVHGDRWRLESKAYQTYWGGDEREKS